MAVQNRIDSSTIKLILSENSVVRNETIAQERQQATDILPNTVMAQIAATEQWIPWITVVGTDGSAVPRGIYIGEDILLAADIAAGDIDDVPILVGNAWVNESLVVFQDDTLNAATVVAPATVEARTARAALAEGAGIFLKLTVEISAHENV